MHALVCPLCHIALPDVDDVCPRDGHTGREVSWVPVPTSLRQRFQVLEPFAHGDSGSLYIADEPETGRRGLLKVLIPAAKEQLAERHRLRRELVKQATLTRTHLVVPLASGETDGFTWLFREWLDGIALEVRLSREGALQQTEALAIAAQIATALDELHRGGLLHRDVEPGHIFLQPTPHGIPRALLLDAGVVRPLPVQGSRAPIYGSAGYVAPEQLLGKLVSFRSDLYSLGCVLYRMLTGRPAFAGDSLEETLAAQRYGEVPPMPSDLPNGIGALLQSILAKDPQSRPFSAQKLRRTLDPFLPDGALMEKQPTTTFETVPEPKSSIAPQPSGTLRPPAPPSAQPSRPAPPVVSQRPPTHSAPPPPPPRSLREDQTQQIDLSQIEELRTASPRRTLSFPPPPAPGSASSVPPPTPRAAQLSEKTQPIRLDQILAVAHAQRASASSPPPSARAPEAAARSTHDEEAARVGAGVTLPGQPSPFAAPSAAQSAGVERADDELDDEKTNYLPVSPSQRPLFSVHDEPASAPGGDPALFQTPKQSFAPPSFAESPIPARAAATPAGDLQAGAHADAARAATDGAEHAGPAPAKQPVRKATLMGMGQDPIQQQAPPFDPSLELPTQELHTRELKRERDHTTERPPQATPSEASEGPSTDLLGSSMSLPGAVLSSQGVPRDTRKLLMYASAALVGLAVLGVGASALLSDSDPVAGRAVEAHQPPPLPAVAAAPAVEPAAVALAEAPRPTVEALPAPVQAPAEQPAPAAAVSKPAESPAAAAPRVDEAAQAQATARAAAAAQAQATARAAAAAASSSSSSSSSKRGGDEPARAKVAASSRDKEQSSNAKSSNKGGAADKAADKAALFAAARDEARTFYAAKRYKDAAAAYERAARYDPKHPGTFAGLGAARLQLGDNKAAVDAYKRAVQLSPDTAGFHAALGRAYLQLGDKSKATSSYKKALAVDPKNEAAKTALKQLGG
jgi:eukaryotic-like serine/threonine-protein kinase